MTDTHLSRPPHGAPKLPLTSAVVLALFSLGCGDDLEIPEPPNMAALVQAYQKPTGELNAATAVDLGEEVVTTLATARSHTPVELAGNFVNDLQDLGGGAADPDAEGDGSGTQQVNGETIDLAAVARIHYICSGWNLAPLDESVNGSTDLTVTLDSGGVIPVTWGYMQHCRFERGDWDLELDGDLRIRFGTTEPRVGLRFLQNLGYLINFEGNVITELEGTRSEFSVNSHFQVYLDGRIRMLIQLASATFVTEFDAAALDPSYGDPMLVASVFTATSTWSCQINLSDASGTCSDRLDPDSVVSW